VETVKRVSAHSVLLRLFSGILYLQESASLLLTHTPALYRDTSDSKSVWAKVRHLTGRSKTTVMDESHSAAFTADSLNRHYAEVSRFKCPATPKVSEYITEWRVFNMLEALRPTATGLDDLPV